MGLKYRNFYLLIAIEVLMLFGVFGSKLQNTFVGIDLDPSCIDPVTACTNAEVLHRVHDPEDCHQYYDCITDTAGNIVPSDNPLKCPDGQIFGYEAQSCVAETYSCTKACINKQCDSNCTGNGLVADEYDCGTFYICINGNPSPATKCIDQTPDKPYFNGNECTENEYSCCVFCVAYCDKAGTEVEDPYDCKSYYLCEEVGDVHDELHFECPEGEYFDVSLGVCSTEDATYPCQNTC